MQGEFQTKYYTRAEEEVISEFALAYLEDTGFYKANYYIGGLMRYGKNKKCAFIKDRDRCINNSEINRDFENEFFNSTNNKIDASCSSRRLGRAYSFFCEYENISTYYQYFGNEKYGGYFAADYCPIPRLFGKELNLNYFPGSCSELGDGIYGSFIYYIETWKESDKEN